MIPATGLRVSAPRSAAAAEAFYSIACNGTTGYMSCGSGATLDDLHAGSFSVDGWFYSENTNNYEPIIGKGDWSRAGWWFWHNNGSLGARVWYSTTATFLHGQTCSNGAWHHITMTFSAVDLKCRIYVDGVLKGTSGAAAGTAKTDAADSLYLQRDSVNFSAHTTGWMRVSTGLRWVADFVAPAKTPAPTTDGTTVLLLRQTEGAGASVADSSGNGNNGTLYGGYTWAAL